MRARMEQEGLGKGGLEGPGWPGGLGIQIPERREPGERVSSSVGQEENKECEDQE